MAMALLGVCNYVSEYEEAVCGYKSPAAAPLPRQGQPAKAVSAEPTAEKEDTRLESVRDAGATGN